MAKVLQFPRNKITRRGAQRLPAKRDSDTTCPNPAQERFVMRVIAWIVVSSAFSVCLALAGYTFWENPSKTTFTVVACLVTLFCCAGVLYSAYLSAAEGFYEQSCLITIILTLGTPLVYFREPLAQLFLEILRRAYTLYLLFID
jgi:cation transport ATPase